MLTIQKVVEAMKLVNADDLQLPIKVVTSMALVEKGEMEGAVALHSQQIVGAALTNQGLFLFIGDGEETRNFMIGSLPPGFSTGDPEIDNRLRGIEPGDEWKQSDE